MQEQNTLLSFKCNCCCSAELQIQNAGDGQIMIGTRINGRHRWIGVVLDKDQANNVHAFLKD